MVRARTDFKAEVRKFTLMQDKAKTKRLVDANYKKYKGVLETCERCCEIKQTKKSSNKFAEYFKTICDRDDIFFQPDEKSLTSRKNASSKK